MEPECFLSCFPQHHSVNFLYTGFEKCVEKLLIIKELSSFPGGRYSPPSTEATLIESPDGEGFARAPCPVCQPLVAAVQGSQVAQDGELAVNHGELRTQVGLVEVVDMLHVHSPEA